MISDTQLLKFLKISALISKRIPHYGFISRTLSSMMSSSIVTRQELTGTQYAMAVESEIQKYFCYFTILGYHRVY